MAQSSSRVSEVESADMNETSSLEVLEEVDEDFGFGDDLELNQFDGLPYSSRYYKLLKERHQLPIWESRQEFMRVLESNQLVIISGSTKTGKSTQVTRLLSYILHALFNFNNYDTLCMAIMYKIRDKNQVVYFCTQSSSRANHVETAQSMQSCR